MLRGIFLLTAAMFAVSAPAAGNDIDCVNQIYRDSFFRLNNQSLAIQDTYLQGEAQVAEILAEGIGGNFIPQALVLEVRRGKLNCRQDFLRYNVSCEAQDVDNVPVTVTGWVSAKNSGGQMTLSALAKLKSLKLDTQLMHNSTIPLGEDGLIIPVATMEAKTEAVLEIAGRTVTVKFDQKFNTGSIDRGSFCRP